MEMKNNELSSTQKKILEIAKIHFLNEGFKASSLRQIVKEAGYTQGAFYGYYKSKEDLFCVFVDDVASTIMNLLNDMDKYPTGDEMYTMFDVYEDALPSLIDYLCAHKEEVFLLINKSEGTKYENFLLMIQDVFMSQIVKKIHISGNEINTNSFVFKTLINNYCASIFSIILNKNNKEEIINSLTSMQEFYKYGLLGVMENGKY